MDKSTVKKLLQDAIDQFNSVLNTIETVSDQSTDENIDEEHTDNDKQTKTNEKEQNKAESSEQPQQQRSSTEKKNKLEVDKILNELAETCDKNTKYLKEYATKAKETRKAKHSRSRKVNSSITEIDDDDDDGNKQTESDKEVELEEPSTSKKSEKLDEKPKILKLVPIEQLLSPRIVARTKLTNSRKSDRKQETKKVPTPYKDDNLQTIVLDSDDDYSDSDNIILTSIKSKPNDSKTTNKNHNNNTKRTTVTNDKCKKITIVLKTLPKNKEKVLEKFGLSDVYNWTQRNRINRNKSSSNAIENHSKNDQNGREKRSLKMKITTIRTPEEKRSSERHKRVARYIDDDSPKSDEDSDHNDGEQIESNSRKNIKKNSTRLTNGNSNTKSGAEDGDEEKGSSSVEEIDTSDKTANNKQSKRSARKVRKGNIMSSEESGSEIDRKTNDSVDNDKNDSNDDENYAKSSKKSNAQSKNDKQKRSGKKELSSSSKNKESNNRSSSRKNSKETKKSSSSSDSESDSTTKRPKNKKSTKSDSDFEMNEDSKHTDVTSDSESDIGGARRGKAAKKSNKSDSDFGAKISDSDDSDVRIPKKKIIKRKEKRSSSSASSDSDKSRKPKRKRRRIAKGADDSSSDDEKSPTKGRKNIKKIIKEKDLEDETKKAARIELERKKRIEERQKMYNEYYDIKTEEVKELDNLILDFDEKTKDELISVDKKLVKKLKPHQGTGVKFMWDACFESLKQIKKNPGSGCILAHCMGLGKTLQIVALVHTLFAHKRKTGVEKVLIICPLSTVLNWVNEFKIWLKCCAHNKDIDIYEISKYKQNSERVFQINEWHEDGGVLIMGYDMFRNLSNGGGKGKLSKKAKESLQKSLVDPGPDLVVCDEGHLLKNSKTSLSKAVNQLRTLRRIVLTGTPLQNNLNEYYCMVQFVKPMLLGKYNEYLNRFVNPITNGQYIDSTPRDILVMKKRSHILHKLLDGCVQRRDYGVLAPYLPVKQEYVVYIQLTPLQVKLYQFYIDTKLANQEDMKRTGLFVNYQNFQRIWTHPRVLRYNSDRYEITAQKKRDAMSEDSEGSLKDFIDDDDEDEDTSEDSSSASGSDNGSIGSEDGGKKRSKDIPKASSSRRTRANAQPVEEEVVELPVKEDNPTEWWMSFCPEEELNDMTHSGKLMLLFSLLEECEQIGDKLLVFSQSLHSLDVIEHFLGQIDEYSHNKQTDNNKDDGGATSENKKKFGGYTGSWSLGTDYFRLDGSTSIENRNLACNLFNKESNTRARLFLISTKAGGLGINLVAANRVVIFDVSWNPSHDIQSIFRVYRFGQIKPCYIYRFIAYGTMEEKIYERQVTKLAISKRVIDEHQIDRHYKENDLMELYRVDLEPKETRPTPLLPKDRMFATQLKKFDKIIYKYHEHDSLLENKSEETLNEDEIKAAWEEFEAEKTQVHINYTQQPRAAGMGPVTSNVIFGFRSDVILKLLNLYARQTYPTIDEHQLRQLVPLLLQQLYEKMRTGDTSMYNALLMLQEKLEAPSSYQLAANSNMGVNPYSILMNQQNQYHLQQQQILQNQINSNVHSTLSTNTVIELD